MVATRGEGTAGFSDDKELHFASKFGLCVWEDHGIKFVLPR